MAREVEVKYSEISHSTLRDALSRAGGERAGCSFESNIVFDTPDGDLRRRGMLLRVRRAWGRCKLTLKTPPDGEVPEAFKVWNEYETFIEDCDSLGAIIIALGYPEAFRYEKIREKWRLGGTVVCLDTLPFGEFVEIEGEEAAIRDVSARLALDFENSSTATYHELHQEYRKITGLPPEVSFEFSSEQRNRLKCLYEDA